MENCFAKQLGKALINRQSRDGGCDEGSRTICAHLLVASYADLTHDFDHSNAHISLNYQEYNVGIRSEAKSCVTLLLANRSRLAMQAEVQLNF
jgi:hypothetical protein